MNKIWRKYLKVKLRRSSRRIYEGTPGGHPKTFLEELRTICWRKCVIFFTETLKNVELWRISRRNFGKFFRATPKEFLVDPWCKSKEIPGKNFERIPGGIFRETLKKVSEKYRRKKLQKSLRNFERFRERTPKQLLKELEQLRRNCWKNHEGISWMWSPGVFLGGTLKEFL